MQFQDDVLGGVTLIRPAIQSPNYVTGTAGWAVRADGSAEFNNITLRGSGTTDAVVVGAPTSPQVTISSSGGVGVVRFPTNRAIEAVKASILGGTVNTGAANEFASLVINGPAVTGAADSIRQQFNSQNNDGTSDANVQWLSLPGGGGINTLMSLDKTQGLRVVGQVSALGQVAGQNLSITGTAITAGYQYLTVNTPAATDPSSFLAVLYNNGVSQFNVGATGNATLAGAVIKKGSAWQTPTYAATWSANTTFNTIAGFQQLQFRQDAEDNVWIVGAFKSTGTATDVFTLPAAYRPIARYQIPVNRNRGGTVTTVMAQVLTTGNLSISAQIAGSLPTATDEYFINGKFPLGNI